MTTVMGDFCRSSVRPIGLGDIVAMFLGLVPCKALRFTLRLRSAIADQDLKYPQYAVMT